MTKVILTFLLIIACFSVSGWIVLCIPLLWMRELLVGSFMYWLMQRARYVNRMR